MTTPTPHDAAPAPDLDTMLALARRLAAAAVDDPALAGVEIEGLLRHAGGRRIILSGRFGGRDAVLRLHLNADADFVAAEWAEMQRLWSCLGDGAARVAEPLHCNPAHGIVITERVPGIPLLQALWQAEPESRPALIAPAADWLRICMGDRAAIWPEGRRYWLRRAAEMHTTQPHRWLKRIEAGILTELERIARQIRRTKWRMAVLHGDFHAANLIVGEGRITAIDTGASSQLPIYKDMARFMTHMARRGMIPSGRRLYGVDAGSVAQFTQAFDLSAQEAEVVLPFMIGVETLMRVEPEDAKRVAIRRAADMAEGLLEDLRQV